MQRIRWLLTRLHMRVRTRICRSDSLEEHIDFCSDKCHKCSENVRCPTVISSTVALFPVLSLRVRPPTIKVVLPLRKSTRLSLPVQLQCSCSRMGEPGNEAILKPLKHGYLHITDTQQCMVPAVVPTVSTLELFHCVHVPLTVDAEEQ